ncbi:hypothetical protein HPB52_003622 [Rhipicephalus sanguineus]|uniref:Uncharacterized protein n=1 Tax=Rhipicephalus sanguineus TaxID=34632 RepID=A0A9D4PUC5_RHISA|nr:hypothetical protein HPB52_003622 [Rhipicephalus sanguineus]
MSKNMRLLCSEMAHLLEHRTARGLSIEDQLLCALRFFATGSFQSSAIVDVGEQPGSVAFPRTASKQGAVKQGFLQRGSLAGVIGCADGTFITIAASQLPPAQKASFWCRYYALNTMVYDSDMKILPCDPSSRAPAMTRTCGGMLSSASASCPVASLCETESSCSAPRNIQTETEEDERRAGGTKATAKQEQEEKKRRNVRKRARGFRPRRRTKRCAARGDELRAAFLGRALEQYVPARSRAGSLAKVHFRWPVQGSSTRPPERLLPGCRGRGQDRGRGLPGAVLVGRGLTLALRSCDLYCWVGRNFRLNGGAHGSDDAPPAPKEVVASTEVTDTSATSTGPQKAAAAEPAATPSDAPAAPPRRRPACPPRHRRPHRVGILTDSQAQCDRHQGTDLLSKHEEDSDEEVVEKEYVPEIMEFSSVETVDCFGFPIRVDIMFHFSPEAVILLLQDWMYKRYLYSARTPLEQQIAAHVAAGMDLVLCSIESDVVDPIKAKIRTSLLGQDAIDRYGIQIDGASPTCVQWKDNVVDDYQRRPEDMEDVAEFVSARTKKRERNYQLTRHKCVIRYRN